MSAPSREGLHEANAGEIPWGKASVFTLTAGDRLVITAVDGGQGGDLSFVGFDQALTRNIIGWRRYGEPRVVFHADEGMPLVDGEGTEFLEVSETNAAGRCDIMLPGCWRELYPDHRPGCRDLIAEALGIERRAITGMLSFFSYTSSDAESYNGLVGGPIEPGDYCSFRARRAVSVAVSACPDDRISGWTPGRLHVAVDRTASVSYAAGAQGDR